MTSVLGPIFHVTAVLALPAALTLGLRRLFSPRFEESPPEAARARRRVLSASVRVEFFLAYSFLLLAPQYELFDRAVESLGTWPAVALFSVPPLACYLLGSLSRAAVDARVGRLTGSILAHWKAQGLLLSLRMGLYILSIPIFFLPFYDLSAPLLSAHNLLGFTLVSLLFFLYVLRGMNVLFRVFGRVEPLDDPELRREMLDFAGRRRIPLADVGVLRTAFTSIANAFAHFGSNRVVVTERLRDTLSRDELRAVLLHEIGHLGQWTTNLIRIGSSYLAFLVYLYLRPLIEAAAQRRVGVGFVALFFAGFLAISVAFRIAFGRFVHDSEARADVFAVDEGGGRAVYVKALRKIHLANLLPSRGVPEWGAPREGRATGSHPGALEGSEGEGWV
jgi:Zn-dependent protease with chaperone function